MAVGKQSGQMNITFNLDTDHGRINVPAPIHTMSSLQVNPEAPVNENLIEDQLWEFPLVRRSVRSLNDPDQPGLSQPASLDGSFRIDEASVHEDKQEFPGYIIKDTTYRVTLLNRSVGMHKAFIDFKDKGVDGPGRLSIPVTWQRSHYLSTAPRRVTLGTRPVRVFLRCPDSKVELVEIVESPDGIKAVISGAREVTLTLGENAPGIIQGDVRVKTTASNLGPLLIPVIRYKPSIATK